MIAQSMAARDAIAATKLRPTVSAAPMTTLIANPGVAGERSWYKYLVGFRGAGKPDSCVPIEWVIGFIIF